MRIGLRKAVLDTAAATEGLHAEVEDHTQQQRELHPANPAERNDGLEGIAVADEVLTGVDALLVANSVRERSGTAEPKDPSEENEDTVASNRRENATNASNEENQLKGKPRVYVRRSHRTEHSTSQ